MFFCREGTTPPNLATERPLLEVGNRELFGDKSRDESTQRHNLVMEKPALEIQDLNHEVLVSREVTKSQNPVMERQGLAIMICPQDHTISK